MADFLTDFPAGVIRVLEKVDNWSFDARELFVASNGEPLKYLVLFLFIRYGFIQRFNIPIPAITNYLNRLEEGYTVRNAAYHNTLHATEVTQTMHFFITQTGLQDWMTDLEILSAIFAAAIHDYEHLGFTNHFLVMSNNTRAKIYNDQSPTQNHHVSAALRLLKYDDSNFVWNMNRKEFRFFRSLAIEMALNTDVDFHKKLIKSIEKALKSKKTEIDRSLVLSLVLHTADVMNPGKHWSLHCVLVRMIMHELYNQGDIEIELDLAPCNRCDRDNIFIADSEMEHIEEYIKPLVDIFAELAEHILEKTIKKPWIPNISKNLERWEDFKVDNWTFDAKDLSIAANGQPLKYLVYYLFLRYGFIQKYNIPIPALRTFLNHIENGYARYYPDYHNSLHAAEITQTMHFFLTQVGLEVWMTDLEKFAAIFAPAIHDYEHLGFTNKFLVTTNHTRAKIYNNQSPNENHHIRAAFRVLKRKDSNFLTNMGREDFQSFQTLVADMVLNTDPDFHNKLIVEMQKALNTLEPKIDKTLGLSLVLHTADILNPGKHWPLHCTLVKLLMNEFFKQDDKEIELGLPACKRRDRYKTKIPDSEVKFIQGFVEPLLKVFANMAEHVLNKTIQKPWLEKISYNLKKWKSFAVFNTEVICTE